MIIDNDDDRLASYISPLQNEMMEIEGKDNETEGR